MKSSTVLNILLFFESWDGWRRLKDERIAFSHIVAFSSCGIHWLLLCHGGRSTVRVFSEESGDESTEHFSAMNRKVVEKLALELSTLAERTDFGVVEIKACQAQQVVAEDIECRRPKEN